MCQRGVANHPRAVAIPLMHIIIIIIIIIFILFITRWVSSSSDKTNRKLEDKSVSYIHIFNYTDAFLSIVVILPFSFLSA